MWICDRYCQMIGHQSDQTCWRCISWETSDVSLIQQYIVSPKLRLEQANTEFLVHVFEVKFGRFRRISLERLPKLRNEKAEAAEHIQRTSLVPFHLPREETVTHGWINVCTYTYYWKESWLCASGEVPRVIEKNYLGNVLAGIWRWGVDVTRHVGWSGL